LSSGDTMCNEKLLFYVFASEWNANKTLKTRI